MPIENAERSSEPSRGVRTLNDADALHALRALEGPYLPWSSGSMRPRGLVMVCNDIVLGGRRRVVELGSGASTVLLSRLGTQLAAADDFTSVAVEHDERWAGWVGRQLASEFGDGGAAVVTAPLGPHPYADDHLQWYDETAVMSALDVVLGGDLIDLLIVDGPPAFDEGMGTARAPALPVLWDRLVSGATIVLDDIERAGEQEVLRRWEAQFDVVFERHPAAGVAVATRP